MTSYIEKDFETPEERIEHLQTLNQGLQESMRTLSAFQKRLLQLTAAATLDDALDIMETLLDEAVEFVYMRLYLLDAHGEMKLHREMCPEELEIDWSLVEWACRTQELAVIPLEDEGDAPEGIESILLLPMASPSGSMGVLVLWVDFDPSEFTQLQSALLTMLAHETAGILQTQEFRNRIEQARALMNDVVESVPLGILALDAEGRISLLNRTMEFMLGVGRRDALEAYFGAVLPEAVVQQLQEMIADSIPEERQVRLDLRGTEETFGLTCTAIYRGDPPEQIGHVVVCRDLKLSQEVAKLRELDAMKNDFLSLVSHELRTPLTSIMAYAETLLMEGMIDTEEERKEYLQIIYEEGGRLSRLINDVLDLTKMEAGKMEYHYEAFDINDLAESGLAATHSIISQKGVDVSTDLQPDLPAVRLDHDRIMQVLTNLLSNAVKFTPEEGKVTLRTRLSPGPAGQADACVTVSVEDTGIGIAPESLDRVFSKFEQVENIDHHSVGTGLGMPICKQIIEEGHGGRIWIESEVGKGTTVFFSLPLA